jgi:hypothetical protein
MLTKLIPSDPRLDIVGRRVEVLADVGHQTGGEVTKGPVVVNLPLVQKLIVIEQHVIDTNAEKQLS